MDDRTVVSKWVLDEYRTTLAAITQDTHCAVHVTTGGWRGGRDLGRVDLRPTAVQTVACGETCDAAGNLFVTMGDRSACATMDQGTGAIDAFIRFPTGVPNESRQAFWAAAREIAETVFALQTRYMTAMMTFEALHPRVLVEVYGVARRGPPKRFDPTDRTPHRVSVEQIPIVVIDTDRDPTEVTLSVELIRARITEAA